MTGTVPSVMKAGIEYGRMAAEPVPSIVVLDGVVEARRSSFARAGSWNVSIGKGSALGAVLGALVIQMINSGIVILGIDQNYSQIITGAVSATMRKRTVADPPDAMVST